MWKHLTPPGNGRSTRSGLDIISSLIYSIHTEERKRAVLLTLVSSATYDLISNVMAPKKPGDVKYDDLVKALADHYNPAPSEIVQQFKFNSRYRKAGESVATFVTELRAIATFCNFGDMLEAMLRDRIVCGISDSTFQKQQLLLAQPKLTFQKALELARGLETAAQNVKELTTVDGPGATAKTGDVHRILSNKPRQKTNVVCFRCGKPGHFVSEATEEDAPIFHVHTEEKTPAYQVTVNIDNCTVAMEVDTGSSVSLVSKSTIRKLWPDKELLHCHYRRSCANEPIVVEPFLAVLNAKSGTKIKKKHYP